MSFPVDDLPTVLAFSDYLEPVVAVDTQFSTSPEFRQHMSTFLSDLMLWQDVLEHCTSAEIKRTLLDHFEILFLKQVLWVITFYSAGGLHLTQWSDILRCWSRQTSMAAHLWPP